MDWSTFVPDLVAAFGGAAIGAFLGYRGGVRVSRDEAAKAAIAAEKVKQERARAALLQVRSALDGLRPTLDHEGEVLGDDTRMTLASVHAPVWDVVGPTIVETCEDDALVVTLADLFARLTEYQRVQRLRVELFSQSAATPSGIELMERLRVTVAELHRRIDVDEAMQSIDRYLGR